MALVDLSCARAAKKRHNLFHLEMIVQCCGCLRMTGKCTKITSNILKSFL